MREREGAVIVGASGQADGLCKPGYDKSKGRGSFCTSVLTEV